MIKSLFHHWIVLSLVSFDTEWSLCADNLMCCLLNKVWTGHSGYSLQLWLYTWKSNTALKVGICERFDSFSGWLFWKVMLMDVASFLKCKCMWFDDPSVVFKMKLFQHPGRFHLKMHCHQALNKNLFQFLKSEVLWHLQLCMFWLITNSLHIWHVSNQNIWHTFPTFQEDVCFGLFFIV